MSDVAVAPETASTADPTGVVAYISVHDARRALEWYADAFGARPRGEPIVMPDGRIGHAELDLEGGVVMLSDPHPEIGVVAPMPGQGNSVTLHASVADVDALTERAVTAGAVLERPPGDNPYGRIAVLRDPFGHRWMLDTPVARAAAADEQGGQETEVAYLTMEVVDSAKARAFYGAVLGWRFSAGRVPDGWNVEGVTPMSGLSGGHRQATTVPMYRVDDIAAAVKRVRAAGGTASDPARQPYGVTADCTDDQGTRFYLGQL